MYTSIKGSINWTLTRRSGGSSDGPRRRSSFDNAADHADTIGQLCERAKASSRDLLIVGAERTRRLNRVLEGVAADILCAPEVTNVRFLSDADIQSVIRKLSEKVRLGPLTRASPNERKRYFQREHQRQLFPALIGLGAHLFGIALSRS